MNRARKHRCALAGLAMLCAGATLAHAAIFPDQLGDLKKGRVETIGVPDQALYNEYGFDATEQAEYTGDHKHMSATAWRMRDTTGAMALFEARRPPGAIAIGEVSKLAVRTSDGTIFAYGNYVFQLTGDVPEAPVLESMFNRLPKLDGSPLPVLMNDLPQEGLIPNSERYLLGPVSLERFEPRIPPSVAAFHLSAEGQLGSYRTPKGPMTMVIFHYPTPNMARERTIEFQKIPGAIARRVGVLVAVTVAPPDPDEAERILGRVHYDTNLTINEPVPDLEIRDKMRFIMNVFVFSGLLIVGCLVAGFSFGGYRALRRKLRHGEDPDAMITLHLSE